jgi:small subunit ribosomal protein S2
MPKTNFEELLNAGVHFGHLKRKWNPNMAPYIFMEKNGIHIIDLHKTIVKLDEAAIAIKQIAKSGRKILFVATKKQAKDIVAERIKAVNMPYVTERWPGGMLTNFPTIRKAVKKMSTIDKMATDGTYDVLSKREKLQVARQRAKLEKNLGSIADLTRLPAAMFVVDIVKENIAVREATRLNIPVFAIVDTNSNPNLVDFPIPANDDASKSIDLIVSYLAEAIEEGLSERKLEKDKETTAKDKKVKDAKDAKEAKEAAALRKLKLDDLDEEDEDEDDDSDEDEDGDDVVAKPKPLSLQGIVDDEDEVKVVEEVKKPRIVKKVVRKKED